MSYVFFSSGPQTPRCGSTGTGPGNSKMYTGGDTTHFLGMWLVGFSQGNTIACIKRERHRVDVLPGRGKTVKRWPVRGYKKLGTHYTQQCGEALCR